MPPVAFVKFGLAILVELSEAAPAPVQAFVMYGVVPPVGVATNAIAVAVQVSGPTGEIVAVGLAVVVILTVLLWVVHKDVAFVPIT